ncbi:MAG: PQQ-binding-like beta-propeller repeat protein [Bacteriovoracia bacterium]
MQQPSELVPMIIPTVMIPLTLVSVGVSVAASFIAGLFGVELKLEGPRKLLEVLLKPRVLAMAFGLNAVIFGGIYVWKYWTHYPRLLVTIEREMRERAKPSAYAYPDVAQLAGEYETGAAVSSTPLALEQVWRVELEAGVFRGATVSGERVFVGNKLGVISEFDLATGKLVRTFYTGTMVSPEITIWGNFLFVGEGVHDTHHARIYRFDLATGQFAGSYQTQGHTEGQAIVAGPQGGESLFVVAGTDGLHVLDPRTLKLKWRATPGHMDAAVEVRDGVVFAGTGREKGDDSKNKTYAVALKLETGEELWKHELPASSWMRPVVVNEHVCFITGEIYFPSERGHVVCFDRASGAHTAGVHLPQPLASSPKRLGESILYTSIKGLVCRFDLATRQNRWCFDAKESGISFAGASYDGRLNAVLYPSLTKGLFILEAETGKLMMNWLPTDAEGPWQRTYADLSVVGDYWVLGDYEKSVRALRVRPELQTMK